MKKRSVRLYAELLGARDVPSTSPGGGGYLSGPDIDLAVTNVHYAGVHSSQPVTGTVTVTNPHRVTGKFDVVAVWAEGVDSQNRPTGRTETIGTDTETITPPNAVAKHGQGFKVPTGDPTPPSWANYLVAQVNPDGQVPETRDDDNFFAVAVSAQAHGQSVAPVSTPTSTTGQDTGPDTATTGAGIVDTLNAGATAVFNGFGQIVDTLNAGAGAVLDAGVAGATNGLGEAVDALNAGAGAVIDAGVSAATSGLGEAVDALNAGAGAVIDAGIAGATSGLGEAVDTLNAGAGAVFDAGVAGATNGLGEAVDTLNAGATVLSDGFGQYVDTLNAEAGAILNAGAAAATNGVSQTVDALNADATAVFDGFGQTVDALNSGAATVLGGLGQAGDALNNEAGTILNAAETPTGFGQVVDMLNAGAGAVLNAGAVAATSGVSEAVDLLNNNTPHAIGLQFGGAVTAGGGAEGVGHTSSVGIGLFYDDHNGFSVGTFTTTGHLEQLPSGNANNPAQPDAVTGNFSDGVFAGGGFSVFVSNGQKPDDISSNFNTWSLDAGYGFEGSGQLSTGHNSEGQPIWQLSAGTGVGGGWALSGYQTNTDIQWDTTK